MTSDNQNTPKILLTRPQAQSEQFAKMCRDATGATPVISPLIWIETLPIPPIDTRFKGVIFTSVNGVNACPPANIRAYCVGDKTMRVAQDAGFDAVSAGGNAGDLVELILGQTKGPLIHVRGEHVRGDIATVLTQRGVPIQPVTAYRQTPRPLTKQARNLLEGYETVILPLFSPRTAKLFVAEMGNACAPIHIIAISDAVAQVVSGLENMTVTVADAPNADATLQAIKRHYDA